MTGRPDVKRRAESSFETSGYREPSVDRKKTNAEKEMTDSIRKDPNRPYFERDVVNVSTLQ
jgi:hypothetical protein